MVKKNTIKRKLTPIYERPDNITPCSFCEEKTNCYMVDGRGSYCSRACMYSNRRLTELADKFNDLVKKDGNLNRNFVYLVSKVEAFEDNRQTTKRFIKEFEEFIIKAHNIDLHIKDAENICLARSMKTKDILNETQKRLNDIAELSRLAKENQSAVEWIKANQEIIIWAHNNKDLLTGSKKVLESALTNIKSTLFKEVCMRQNNYDTMLKSLYESREELQEKIEKIEAIMKYNPKL